ncbi:hypothetical protein KP509_33G042500 [Ceratopteris richardii]|uniref:Villin n=1 Tax=Ceratopteris richardii TaxID=49495 RepID=A0A8T2QPE9_CERRI|nr:hypothetical protein KP509_33G042500 [Ceratopteris richardii]
MKGVDSAFRHGVGVQAGLEVWQIEDSRLKVLQKGEHGKFISDQSYIILQTRLLLNGALQHSIHCWCGPQTSQNDVERAAIKAVELNASLGNRAVITCEKAGYESDRFLSYFKPCFIPIQRKTNQHPTSETSKYHNRIFLYKGRHVARITEVPFSRSSLSHDGIFLVDTRHKVFQFNGANTDPYERAKALDAVQYLMDNLHKEKCPIAVIDDGKLVADIDSGEFWALFGGYAPLIKKMGNGSHGTSQSSCELHVVHDGQINETQAAPLRKEMLKGNRTCILDCDREVFAWMGHRTSLEDRKIAFVLAERLCSKKRNPHENKLFCVNEDFEPVEFQMKFDVWPLSKKSAFSESGREKVAVLLKQRGLNVKGLLKPAPVVEKLQLISNTGNLQVWCLERGFKECLQTSELLKLKSRNCYTILHSFSANQKEEHFIYTWIGDQSSTETRASATSHAKEIANSFQGRAVEVQIFQGKEPSYFYSLFSKLIITEMEKEAFFRFINLVLQNGVLCKSIWLLHC